MILKNYRMERDEERGFQKDKNIYSPLKAQGIIWEGHRRKE